MRSSTPKSPMERYRKIAVLIGILLFLAALFGNIIGISSGEGIGFGQIFTALSGILIVLAGAFGRRFVNGYRSVAIMILNTLILLALLEFSALILIKMIGIENFRQVNQREQIQNRDLRESGLIFPDQEYYPFIMWRSAPVSLPLMNVNQSGIRRTYWVPPIEGIRIFALGGSAMWGWMVPDSSTIPSCLQKEINSIPGFEASVTNLAQNAWVSTQEVTELMLRLRSGDIPDLLIFYNGANDIFASFENGKAGMIIGNRSIAGRLSVREDQSGASPDGLTLLLRSTNIFMLMDYLIGTEPEVTAPNVRFVAAAPCFDDPGFDLAPLAGATAAHYLENYRIVEALSKEYDFQFYFFLQPLLCFETDDSHPGASELLETEDERFLEFVRITYSMILDQRNDYPRLIPVQDIFDGEEVEIFIDLCHLNASGNEKVAAWMAQYLYAGLAVSSPDTLINQ